MVKKSAKRDKEEWIQGKCNDIEKGLQVGNHRQAYSLIKMLTKKHTQKTDRMSEIKTEYFFNQRRPSTKDGHNTVAVFTTTKEAGRKWFANLSPSPRPAMEPRAKSCTPKLKHLYTVKKIRSLIYARFFGTLPATLERFIIHA